jgi:virginiamycin B lyase
MLRPVALLCALALLSACSGKMGQPGTLLPGTPGSGTASIAGTPGHGTLIVRVKTAGRSEKPDYISTATQGISIAITGPTKVKEVAGLVANAKGCQSSVMTVECTLAIPGLAACPSSKNCYTASVTTYDKFNSATNKIPAGARKLSADLNFSFSIQAGDTVVPLVLQGIVKTVAFVPGPTSLLGGSQKAGFVEPKCSAKQENVSVIGLDADRNYILGVGAPTVTLTTDDKAQLGVLKPKPPSPNAFVLVPPHAPNYPYGNHTIHLTASATPGAQSGGKKVSAIVAVTYSGDICGKFTEFAIPTAASHPYGITTGPDGNLWFTESTGNNVGRITTSGAITEFPVPTTASGPAGIVAGPDGNLWFVESAASKVGKMTTAGSAVEFPTITAAAGPINITKGPDGNLWFTEGNANNVARITTGGIVSEFPVITAASTPYGITSGPDGNLWFTEISGNKIGTSTTTGTVSEFTVPTAASHPPDITTGSDGAMWFVECTANQVGRITTGGTFTSAYPTPDLSPTLPVFITQGPDGAVWFTEAGVNKIGSSTTGGSISEFAIPTGGAEPFHVTQGPDGAIWFVEEGGNKIGRLR